MCKGVRTIGHRTSTIYRQPPFQSPSKLRAAPNIAICCHQVDGFSIGWKERATGSIVPGTVGNLCVDVKNSKVGRWGVGGFTSQTLSSVLANALSQHVARTQQWVSGVWGKYPVCVFGDDCLSRADRCSAAAGSTARHVGPGNKQTRSLTFAIFLTAVSVSLICGRGADQPRRLLCIPHDRESTTSTKSSAGDFKIVAVILLPPSTFLSQDIVIRRSFFESARTGGARFSDSSDIM